MPVRRRLRTNPTCSRVRSWDHHAIKFVSPAASLSCTHRRYPEDPVTHTALGYFFISTDERVSSLRVLDKAATAFERAKTTTNGDAFLPSTRGLAVVARRRALRKAARGWRAFSAMENDAAAHQVGNVGSAGVHSTAGVTLLHVLNLVEIKAS